ncbi:MAG: ribosome-binding factor A, partial [Rhodospirillales bacterium]|nr:ribosome-binding factor A [Rhodospirillales bacterium]
PFLRHQIAERVHLRHVPNLTFEADTSFDYAEHISQILNDVTADNIEQAAEEDS